MKKIRMVFFAIATLALLATGCGGGGGGSDDDDETPVAESSTGTGGGSSGTSLGSTSSVSSSGSEGTSGSGTESGSSGSESSSTGTGSEGTGSSGTESGPSGSGSTSAGTGSEGTGGSGTESGPSGSGSTSSGSGSGSGGTGGGSTSTSVPEGFVLVQGATFDGTTAITGSHVFIAGRTITIPNLLVCDHEVTQAEYQSVMLSNPSYFSSKPASGETQESRPVDSVSWYDAIMYCNKRSADEGRTPCYKVDGKTDTSQWNYRPHRGNSISGTITCDFGASGYRLPTEAEWEYLARGGNLTNNGQTKYSGSNTLVNVAWYGGNSGGKTHEVKKKVANALGLYDMSGNVYELCWDLCTRPAFLVTDPGVTSDSCRVSRGGGWISSGSDDSLWTVSVRFYPAPESRHNNNGFRVVCSRSE